jgi:hypothetical protein
MKVLLCILIAFFPLTNLFSQKNISKFSGFLVTNTNDTIKSYILVTDHSNNLELSNLFDEVTYVDSVGKRVTANAYQHISSFHFIKDNKNYDFEKISLDDVKNKKNGFALRIIKGSVSLYLYSSNSELTLFRPTLNPNNQSTGDYTQRYIYNFLKEDGVLSLVKTKKSLKNVPGVINTRWLKEYFSDDEILVKKIGKELDVSDLELIVKEYNLRHQ